MKRPNPFLPGDSEGPKNLHGRKAEKRLAKRYGAKLTPASGALGKKGDMVKQGKHVWRTEAKSTIKKSMVLQYRWLQKIAKEASMAGETPALIVTFTTPDGGKVDSGDWVLIPAWAWE